MNLLQLEQILPGESVSRREKLEHMRAEIQTFVGKYKLPIAVHEVTYNDVSCNWVRFSHQTAQDCCRTIADEQWQDDLYREKTKRQLVVVSAL